ncbi:MAG TPA: caspase family protein [Desulfuromonadaceae bacterium]
MRIFAPLIVCTLLALASFPAHVRAQEGRSLSRVAKSPYSAYERVALVIGNSAYPDIPLKNPANDAGDVAAELKKAGFHVRLLTNATREQMDKAISAFGREIRPGGVSMFYYAGHGIQAGGINYLVPVDSRIESEDEIPSRGVDVNLVLRKMDSARSRVNIIVLDACRNNPFSRSFRSASRGLAQMAAPKGSVIVYATDPGSVAADGSGRNGIFTKHLLAHMITPGIEVEQMLKQVRGGVEAETRGRQVPWTNTSLTGDFYFVPGKRPLPAAEVAAPLPPVTAAPGPVTRMVNDVELTENDVQGKRQITFRASGSSAAGDAVARRIAARKSALVKIRAAMSAELSVPPYQLDETRIQAIYAAGEVVDLTYGDGGTSAEVFFRVLLPDSGHASD